MTTRSPDIRQLTTEQMRELLAPMRGMSEATRHVLVTGQATFTDADGQRYRAPLTAVDDGPTHTVRAKLVTTKTEGEQKLWNN